MHVYDTRGPVYPSRKVWAGTEAKGTLEQRYELVTLCIRSDRSARQAPVQAYNHGSQGHQVG